MENFGCRATQADGAAIEHQLRERGLDPAATREGAGLVVLNTCTVTAAADQDARAAIRRIHRENPECEILVTGCYAQRAPEELSQLPGVKWVIGNSHKPLLAQIAVPQAGLAARAISGRAGYSETGSFVPLDRLAGGVPPTEDRSHSIDGGGAIFVSDIFAHTELLAAPVFDSANERTRPNLKVQDGCNNRCSFCVIPSVRGQSRSLRLHEVVEQVRQLVSAGYREVVISGINLGRWGRDLEALASQHSQSFPAGDTALRFGRAPGPSLTGLVRAILDETALEKLRISSVEPMDWSDELIQLMATSGRIARHAHVPMQSGSDAVLRRMHRKYRPWHYREKIEKIRAAMPDAAIGADVMVGFPGETLDEFEETRRMIEDLPFTYLHVFTYSSRPGTPSAGMPRQVPVAVARDRNRVLRELAAGKKLEFMRFFIGQPVRAITLHSHGGGYTEALTDNYLKLRVRGQHAANRWITAFVEQVSVDTLLGEMA